MLVSNKTAMDPSKGWHQRDQIPLADGTSREAPGSVLATISEKFYVGKHWPSRKPVCYLEEYERVLAPLRDKPIRFLELGVQGGWSMLMWKEFLPNATIVGVDMAEMPENFPQDERFHFIRSDQADPALAAKALKAAGGFFDVIVDDASHLGFLTANSFRHLFPILAPGGTYIIEDIATCFTGCGEFDDAKFPITHIGVDRQEKIFSSHQHGIIGFVKQLADYTQETVALKTNDWNQWPIYRVSLLPNMAVIDKCGSHLVSPNGCLHP